MKKKYFLRTSFVVILLLTAYVGMKAQNIPFYKASKTYQILYFNPEIFPNIPEIMEPTYLAFFSALSDHLSSSETNKLLRVDYNIDYSNPEPELISEFCENNNAQFAVIPKVKYFKVGFGKYVFSNQVIVSMKIYEANGILLAETSYDTYRKKGRLLGSAENSIKIGTFGALKNLNKILRKKFRADASAAPKFEILPSHRFAAN